MKMKKTTYRLKRKTYGLVGTLVGEPLKGLGRGIKNVFTGTTGTVLGAAAGSLLPLPGIGGVGGALLGATVGKHVAQGVGNAVGKVGESISDGSK